MSLTIYAVGDIMMGEQHLCNNFGVKSVIRKNGSDFLFREVSPLFKDGDIVFGNLECSIRDPNSKSDEKPLFFCAEPDVIQGLKNAHFNALSVANNHIMENGRGKFLHTARLLKGNSITPVGIRNKIEILNIKGYKIAFLGYSFIEDHVADVSYNKIESKDAIISDIAKVKGISDLIIVSLHWGFEYIPYPSPDQIRIGRDLVDAGADIIFGSHPHVTQGYEVYKNRPIFYSLGNFIFDQTYIPMTAESYIAEININDTLDSLDINLIPTVIDSRDYHPQIAELTRKETLLNRAHSTRNLFENRSIFEYAVSIGDYEIQYSKFHRIAKRDMKLQFIRNVPRYSLRTTYDILRQYICKQREV